MAAVVGVAVPPSDSLSKARKRVKTALRSNRKRRHDAEVQAAYAEHKYDEVHLANAELHAKVVELNERQPPPQPPPPTTAAPQPQSVDHYRRKVQQVVHPDRVAAHLRHVPEVMEWSTAVSQEVESCFKKN